MRSATLLEAVDKAIRAAAAKAKLDAVLPLEATCEKALAAAFRKQGKAFVALLDKHPDRWPAKVQEAALREEVSRDPEWEDEFDAAATESLSAFETPLTATATAAMKAGLMQAVATMGIDMSFDLKNPRAVAYLKAHGAELVSKIDETTRDYIRTVVSQGVEEGWSYDRVAKAIIERYDEFAVGRPQEHIESRAHLVAVTEASHAYEAGNNQVTQSLVDAGLEMEKAWLLADENACPDCTADAEAGWIPWDDSFPSGADTPEDSHPACRCAGMTRSVGSEPSEEES